MRELYHPRKPEDTTVNLGFYWTDESANKKFAGIHAQLPELRFHFYSYKKKDVSKLKTSKCQNVTKNTDIYRVYARIHYFFRGINLEVKKKLFRT